MKKVITLVLATMLILALAITTFAESGTDADTVGTITISSIHDDVTYSIYKLLDLKGFDTTAGAYSYKVNSAWTDFFVGGAGAAYVAIDESGFVTWTAEKDDDTLAVFTKAAMKFVDDKGLTPVKTSANTGEFVVDSTGTSGTFSDLELGYYLVDSTMGSLCGLTTTKPTAIVNPKNSAPTLIKQVQEDSLIDTPTAGWGEENTADIGQTVNFQVTITAQAGAQNYVLYDEMDAGFTFNGITSVQHIIPGQTPHDITGYTLKTYAGFTPETTDDVAAGSTSTFEIYFSEENCELFEANDKIIVTYSAMLNRNATVGKTDELGNPIANYNTAKLSYGEGFETTTVQTKTYTFGIDIIKTDAGLNLIDGAEFRIYDAATDGNEIGVVLLTNGVYRRARQDEQANNETVNIVVTDGKIRVVGFDNGTYYLEEKVAPEGYNMLSARQRFIISDANLDGSFTGTTYNGSGGVHVVNKTGAMLPETGGFGTTLFIALGSVMVLGAAVVLFAKKRMSQIAE